MEKGSLRGFFDVRFLNMGMNISCSWFEKDGRKWVNLPAREYEKDGVKKYQSLVRLDDEMYKRFQEKIIAMIEAGDYEVLAKKEVAQDLEEPPF